MGESLRLSTSVASLVSNTQVNSDQPEITNKPTITKRREVDSKPHPQSQLQPQPSTSKNLIYFFGPEILEALDSVSPLTAEKVSEQPAKPGIVKRFINLWEKYFGSLSETETQQVRSIKNTLAEVNDLLERDQMTLKDMDLAKQDRKGQVISPESLVETQRAQVSFRTSFRLLQTKLDRLKALKAQAETLAQKHSNCTNLPDEIQALEKKVEAVSARLTVANELQKLEEAIVKYNNNGSWDNFTAIREQKLNFEKTLRLAIGNRPELQRVKYIKTCLKQQTPLSSATLARMMDRAYPQLSSHLEHLFDHLVIIQEKRISQLEQKAARMNTLFVAYSKIAKEVDYLERHIYTPSWYDYFFNRQAQLEKKQDELIALDKIIQTEGNFNAPEAAWVHALASKNSHYQFVSDNIREMSQAFAHIDNRENVSEQMSILIDLLESYKTSLELTKHQQRRTRQSRRSKVQPHSQRMSSINLQDSTTSAMDNSSRRLVRDIAESLETAVKTIYEGSQQVVHPLPAGFETLSPIEQLKTLTTQAFPKLENRVSHLTHLMQAITDLQTEEPQTLTQQVEEIIRNVQHPVATKVKAEIKPEIKKDPLQQGFIEPEAPFVQVTTPIITRNTHTTAATETVSPKQEEQRETQAPAKTSAEESIPVITPSSESTHQIPKPVVNPTKNSSEEAKEDQKVPESPKVELPKTGTAPPPPPPPPVSKVSTAIRINKTVKPTTKKIETTPARDALFNDIRTGEIKLKKASDRTLPENPLIPKNKKASSRAIQDDLVDSLIDAIAKRGKLLKG